jgi:hypothetical protein
MLHRGVRQRPTLFFVKPSRWWSGGCNSVGEISFNKRYLLWSYEIVLLLLFPLASHGGVGRDSSSAMSCGDGGAGGKLHKYELIHAGGNMAFAILYRQGGDISISIAEALRSHCGGSTTPRHQVVRLRWLGDGPWLLNFVGRELVSTLLSFLGGNA